MSVAKFKKNYFIEIEHIVGNLILHVVHMYIYYKNLVNFTVIIQIDQAYKSLNTLVLLAITKTWFGSQVYRIKSILREDFISAYIIQYSIFSVIH